MSLESRADWGVTTSKGRVGADNIKDFLASLGIKFKEVKKEQAILVGDKKYFLQGQNNPVQVEVVAIGDNVIKTPTALRNQFHRTLGQVKAGALSYQYQPILLRSDYYGVLIWDLNNNKLFGGYNRKKAEKNLTPLVGDSNHPIIRNGITDRDSKGSYTSNYINAFPKELGLIDISKKTDFYMI